MCLTENKDCRKGDCVKHSVLSKSALMHNAK